MSTHNAKAIKAEGRRYAKQAFKLNENDFLELSMLERAYYAGWKKSFQYYSAGDRYICTSDYVLPLNERGLKLIGDFLKDNLRPQLHIDIDRAVFNNDYEAILEKLNIVAYNISHYKRQLEIAIDNKKHKMKL